MAHLLQVTMSLIAVIIIITTIITKLQYILLLPVVLGEQTTEFEAAEDNV